MKRHFQKTIAVFIVTLLTLSILTPALSVSAVDTCNCGNSPIVFVIGRTDLFDDPTSPNCQEIPNPDSEAIKAAVMEALPYAAKAIFLNQWEEYCDVAFDCIAPFFEGYAPNPDGTVTNGTGPRYTWSKESMRDNHKSNSVYSYRYEYDARLSPLDVADDLHNFIESVKEVTGHDKVSIISRCVGVNYAFAYIYKYEKDNDYAGIDTFVLYNGSMNGLKLCEASFSGNIKFTGNAAYRYCMTSLSLDDDILNEFLQATIVLLQQSYGMRLTVEMINHFYDKIYTSLIPDILKISFGATPGYWSMVKNNFNEAKDYIFSAEGDKEKYSVIIDKINYFHDNIQMNMEDMLLEMKAKGVDIAILAKYGFQMVPVYAQADELGDGVIAVIDQSFGATCAETDKTLAVDYLEFCRQHKLDRYISPDLQIDASTGLFPDNTWYIKNLPHNDFPGCMDPLLLKICRTDNMTVNTDANWPQYLLHNISNWSVGILTEENAQTIDWDANDISIFKAIKIFFEKLIALLKHFIGESRVA